MLDAAPYPLRAVAAPALPVAQMVIGMRVEEAAALLPRLFNLCRVAQGMAARAAFGLPLDPEWRKDLQAEILREHVVKLCLKWPGLLSLPALPLPRGWQTDAAALRVAVFGVTGQMPRDVAGFDQWLTGGAGVAPVLRAIAALFAPGEAARPALPLVSAPAFFEGGPVENSAAARHASHPVMQHVKTTLGRGPLWSALGAALDLEAVLHGHLPDIHLQAGRAIVPAARGLYGIRASLAKGRVTRFDRLTPTDHLLAPRGALDHALATLPQGRAAALAPLVLSVMDPCVPVTLQAEPKREAQDA